MGGRTKPPLGTLQVFLNDLHADPPPVQPLADLARHARASEGVEDDILLVGEHADEVLGQLCWKSVPDVA